MYKHLDYTITSVLVLTTIVAGALASSVRVGAEDITDVTDTASVTVPASCSMTATVESEHSASIPNGIYSGSSDYFPNGIGKTKIATFCNDNNGYAIYAIGFTGDKYDGDDHTKLIGATNGQKISTNTTTSGDISSWAMKLIKETDDTKSYNPIALTIENGYDNYNVIPNTYTKVANYTSTTDQTLGSVLSTTYAAYISPTEVADTYIGKVKYTLVHPHTEAPSQPQSCTTGKICYFANVSDYEGTMNTQNVSSSVTLLPSNFSRTGYGFAGWSDKFDYATNPEAKFYGPMATITLNTADYTGTNPGLSLYAVWVKSQGNLQDSAKVASVCNSLTPAPIDGTANLSSVSALTDQRDNNTYAIAKLADNKCWMIENLRLDNTAEHNSDGTLAQGYGTSATYGNFSGLANAESANFSDSTTANSIYYSGTQSGDTTINIGTSNYPGYRMPRYNNTNTTARASSPTTNDNAIYSYGNYYTWHAAIADLTYNGTNNSNVTNTSLCPIGWHLPTGGLAYASGSTSGVNVTGDTSTYREFYNLAYKTMGEVKTAYEDTPSNGYAYYSSNTTNSAGKIAAAAIRSFPNNFLYSGYFFSSSAYFRGSYGYYWSSTAYSDNSSYTLGLSSSSVTPGTNNYGKLSGVSIRCVSGS